MAQDVIVSGVSLYPAQWEIVNEFAVELAAKTGRTEPNISDALRQIILQWYECRSDEQARVKLPAAA